MTDQVQQAHCDRSKANAIAHCELAAAGGGVDAAEDAVSGGVSCAEPDGRMSERVPLLLRANLCPSSGMGNGGVLRKCLAATARRMAPDAREANPRLLQHCREPFLPVEPKITIRWDRSQ